MNIMLATVLERKSEIGIRRAVGAKKKHILCQFLLESVILTFLGGLMGISIGFVLLFILKITGTLEIAITIKAIILPVGVSSITGILAGIYPAYEAARMNPINALTEA